MNERQRPDERRTFEEWMSRMLSERPMLQPEQATPATDHSRVNPIWRDKCKPWTDGIAWLDDNGPQDGWRPSAAMERVQPGLPEDGPWTTLFGHLASKGNATSGALLLPDSVLPRDDSDYAVGIAFDHHAADEGQLVLRSFVYRCICMNGTIWNGQTHLETLRFKASEEAGIPGSVREHLAPLIAGGEVLRDALVEAAAYPTWNPVALLYRQVPGLSRALGMNRTVVARAWLSGWRATSLEPSTRRNTVGAVINGLTRAAQAWDPARRSAAERFAGSMVMPHIGASPRELHRHWQELGAHVPSRLAGTALAENLAELDAGERIPLSLGRNR